MIHIRLAQASEISWINARYDEVRFVHSHFPVETIAIAEFDHQKAGLGRLVILDNHHVELGGIYVFDAFRGKGLAQEIVAFLLKHIQKDQTVYCIPFVPLIPFYKKFGFAECEDRSQAPQKILDKLNFCTSHYTDCATELLVLNN